MPDGIAKAGKFDDSEEVRIILDSIADGVFTVDEEMRITTAAKCKKAGASALRPIRIHRHPGA